MRIAITGSSGLVGSRLVPYLIQRGYQVARIVRHDAQQDDVPWDPAAGLLDAASLTHFDAVVHLAGENIAAGRWSAGKKQRIRDSRVQSTQLLSEKLAAIQDGPRILISASAIGYYGDRGDQPLDESSAAGDDFLSGVCREWEAATNAARDAGIRVVNLRIGVVLARQGGALQKMLTPFRFGAGGRVGSGRQYWSWIAIDDLIAAIDFALCGDHLAGPVNAVAPNPVTNLQFTKALGAVLHRPTIFPLPGFVARTLLGEMADALLLASARVLPKQLADNGFSFDYPELEPALRHVLAADT